MAYILPERSAVCDHGFPIVHPCESCREDAAPAASVIAAAPPLTPSGWECPRCHRVWSPSVLACHHCPEPPPFIAKAHGLYPMHIDGMSCDPPCEDCP